MPLTRAQKAKHQMEPNNELSVNPTWNMNLSTNQQTPGRRSATLSTNTNMMPSIDEIQHNMTKEELEATQQDPAMLMILNVLINNDRDRYLALLVQNGAKLAPGVDILAILPPSMTLNQNFPQAPIVTQTQATLATTIQDVSQNTQATITLAPSTILSTNVTS